MDETEGGLLAGVPVLLATARSHSATKAAQLLGTTTATVLRRLAAMEEALGVRLFDRAPTGLLPTPALELVLPWAEQAEAAASGMKREVQGLETRPVGVVRLALLPVLSSHLVVPALPALRARCPELTLELAPASAVVDLVRREADLALRTVRPDTGDLVVQRLATFRLAVACSPKLHLPRRPCTLADLPWLAWDDNLAHVPEAEWLRANVPGARVVLRSPELYTLLRAAQEGLGALVIPEPIAARAGGLVHVPVPTPEMPEAALWLVAHRSLRPVPRVAAVWEWLERLFQELASDGTLELAQGRSPGGGSRNR